MPRKPRIEYPGAIYHVMSRGNRQEAIFLDRQDCEIFLDTLDEVCKKAGWLVHAFVLMGNHYHLLLETPEANLVAGMKWLQGTYTQRFNSRHGLRGHLLQGRYKALPVDGSGNEYFPTLSSYIHLNPARAGLLEGNPPRLADYEWSSFPLYLRPSKRPDWLVVERVLGALGVEDDRKGLAWYRAYMDRRVSEICSAENPMEADDAWGSIRRGWYLGPADFRDKLVERIDETLKRAKRSSLYGEPMRQHDEEEAERLLLKGLKLLGLDEKSLQELPKGAREKAVLAWYLRANTTAGRTWIAQHLAMGDESRVTKLAKAVGKEGLYRELRKKLQDS